jgi:hypothetical protein
LPEEAQRLQAVHLAVAEVAPGLRIARLRLEAAAEAEPQMRATVQVQVEESLAIWAGQVPLAKRLSWDQEAASR